MHRDPESTYQRRAGRALEERTRAMIVTAAEQVMTAHPDESIAHLTTADVCAAARGYMRRDGTEGPIPKATMWKHFKTISALAAAVVDKMTAENRPVPDRIVALAAGRGDPRPRPDSVDTERLEARFSSRHYEIAQLADQFDKASVRDDRSDMLYWSAELAERHLQQRRRGDRDRVVTARDWAMRGLRLVDRASRLDCMMGIRCARAAAAAEAMLSRRLDYEPTALSRIRSIKESEQRFAEVLGWDLHRELARFHIEHARALVEEDPEREMLAMRTIATTLIAMCGPGSAQHREPQDGLRADELADVIVGLCRMEMAYAADPEHAELFATVFGDGVAEPVRALLACFPASNGGRRRHEGNVRALLRLADLIRRLDLLGPTGDPDAVTAVIEDYEQASVDLLRTAEFGTVRDILVARYLTAKAHALAVPEDRRSDPPGCPADNALVHPRPAGLLRAAIRFYEHAARVTSPRGSAGLLREWAGRAAAELECAGGPHADDPEPVGDGEFDNIVRAINDLLLITMSRRNRFTDSEIQQLLDMVDPLYYYITSGRN